MGKDGTSRAPASHAQGVSLYTRFCRLRFSSHTRIKILWPTVTKIFNNFCHFSCPQKFINNLFQHPDTNPVLLNKMPLNHHAPIDRTSCCFTHITITPRGKNIFLILPVSFKLLCRVAFAFIQDHLLLLLRVKCYLSSVTPHSSDRRSKIRFMIIKPSQSHNYIIKSVGESDKLTS